MSANPTLTTIVIACLVALTLITITFNTYSEFSVKNNGSISAEYTQYFTDIQESSDTMNSKADELRDTTLLRKIFGATQGLITGTINVFVMGLDAIAIFLDFPELITGVLNILNSMFPQLITLIGLAITVIGVYIAMRYVQSARGTSTPA